MSSLATLHNESANAIMYSGIGGYQSPTMHQKLKGISDGRLMAADINLIFLEAHSEIPCQLVSCYHMVVTCTGTESATRDTGAKKTPSLPYIGPSAELVIWRDCRAALPVKVN